MACKTLSTRPAEAVQAPPTAPVGASPIKAGAAELYGLRDLLGLATMAVEADRVLTTLEAWEPHSPALSGYLHQIDGWREWSLHQHHLGSALNYMRGLADRLIDAHAEGDRSIVAPGSGAANG